MSQISDGKQYEAEDRTPQIEIVSCAVLDAPLHPRQHVKCLRYMHEHDRLKTDRAKELQESGHGSSSMAQDLR